MKIYTVDQFEVKPSITVEYVTRPDGSRFACFFLGEEGRGRKRVIIPVVLTMNAYRSWYDNGYVEVSEVRPKFGLKGLTRLEELVQEEKSEEYLVAFLGWIGFRGHNRLTDYDGNAVDKNKILAEGIIAQGAAGRVGWGSQWLLRVRPGDLFRFHVDGRLYGHPSDYVLVCTDKGPLLYTQEVWDAEQALKE
jgi:hypothetical protein